MKQVAIELIDEAVTSGARRHKACQVLGITCRTLRRWRGAESLQDKRKGKCVRDNFPTPTRDTFVELKMTGEHERHGITFNPYGSFHD